MKNQNEKILLTLVAMLELLQKRLPGSENQQGDERQNEAEEKQIAYTEEELMTVRQAYLELNVSRTTINKLRREGKLTSLNQLKNVRLIRAEVIAAKKWYSGNKGKL
ncbi:helix-turn-helix domain-containing protein [Sphingobacterium alkalisoli]|uniref:Helix-turn-helix domain-containing protein n=1 Tax=Sphingobacterium alkalisoli TaxID=1874115 RepID=A0A4U0H2S6_9SPHI|nr:helix-turn-helix domain-containing protein [Sphingobacterium alkalisoli]TJY65798.1 helix-turn-helix domain-containing protein [Sphingobacterium alkalisoli]GGH18251.1 hypothetical protein GCM10011418_21760 [Sphingobacterium alkalisoli]